MIKDDLEIKLMSSYENQTSVEVEKDWLLKIIKVLTINPAWNDEWIRGLELTISNMNKMIESETENRVKFEQETQEISTEI